MKKFLALILALVMCFGIVACGEKAPASDDGAATGGTIKVGYVNPYTGPLAGNGEGCDWVVAAIESYVNDTLGGIDIDGAKYTFDVITYDSKSDSNTCGEMAAKLCDEDEVDMIIAIQTPETVIPVMNAAEAYGVPCIAIQAPVNPVAGNLAGSGEWTAHAFWTIEKVYEQYKALWAAAGYLPNTGAKVGLAFANDADGSAWYSIFTANLEKDGYVLVDPGQYPSGTTDFTNIVNTYKEQDIDILAGTNIPPDFLNLYTQVIAAGIEVGCVTMGKCCLLEGDIGVLEDKGLGIMTEVWWAPTNPYTSALTGVSCEELGAAYKADNGRNMPQPAGYAYAALELAVQAFQNAGTTDKAAVRDAMKALDTTTIVGPIKYDQTMGNLTYSNTVIGGGQWQMIDGALTLKIIDNTVYPEVPVTGEYVAGNATSK
jgi:branched-chain amino acid transport system substrate-binding protein